MDIDLGQLSSKIAPEVVRLDPFQSHRQSIRTNDPTHATVGDGICRELRSWAISLTAFKMRKVEQVPTLLDHSTSPVLIVPFGCALPVREVISRTFSQHATNDVRWAMNALPNVDAGGMCGSIESIAPFPQHFVRRAAISFPAWGCNSLSFATEHKQGAIMCSGNTLPLADDAQNAETMKLLIAAFCQEERQKEKDRLIIQEGTLYSRYLTAVIYSTLMLY